MVGTITESGDRFGWALAAGDFDRDGRDWWWGSPYENWGATTDAGVVHVIYGSSGGLIQSGGVVDNEIWHQNSSGFTLQPLLTLEEIARS